MQQDGVSPTEGVARIFIQGLNVVGSLALLGLRQ